jgi:hypothetical protein
MDVHERGQLDKRMGCGKPDGLSGRKSFGVGLDGILSFPTSETEQLPGREAGELWPVSDVESKKLATVRLGFAQRSKVALRMNWRGSMMR